MGGRSMVHMNIGTALRLARISNLPTVWTNVLAGALLGGRSPELGQLVATMGLGSALYIGGMVLNDAFDAEYDIRERADRPIPRGEVTVATVFRWGFGLLGAAVATSVALVLTGVLPWSSVLVTLGIAALVVAYDAWHKGNPGAPVLMGTCRAGLYLLGASVVDAAFAPSVLLHGLLLLSYVAGITYVARFESRAALRRHWPLLMLVAPVFGALPWLAIRPGLVLLPLAACGAWVSFAVAQIRRGQAPRIRRGVVALICGISLVDAVFVAALDLRATVFALAAFGLSLWMQRSISGT